LVKFAFITGRGGNGYKKEFKEKPVFRSPRVPYSNKSTFDRIAPVKVRVLDGGQDLDLVQPIKLTVGQVFWERNFWGRVNACRYLCAAKITATYLTNIVISDWTAILTLIIAVGGYVWSITFKVSVLFRQLRPLNSGWKS
jgi:hypothetical protein